MFNFLRALPTPTYGNYGGAYRSSKDNKPIDWMDEAFKKHDEELRAVNEEFRQLNEKKKNIDRNLGKSLVDGDPKKIKKYGKVYRYLAMFIFRG